MPQKAGPGALELAPVSKEVWGQFLTISTIFHSTTMLQSDVNQERWSEGAVCIHGPTNPLPIFCRETLRFLTEVVEKNSPIAPVEWKIIEMATMQIKTTMRYHLFMLKWMSSKKQEITSVSEDVEKRQPFVHCCWECKLVLPLCKTVWQFLKKLIIRLPCNLGIPLLGICPKETKSLSWRDICILIFIAALFIIVKCLSKMNNFLMCYIYTKDYSAIKKKEILPFVTPWNLTTLCRVK